MRILLAGYFCLICLVGCGSLAPTDELTVEPLALTSTKWVLGRIVPADGKVMFPDDPTKYTAEFDLEGKVNVRADCNYGNGNWSYLHPTRIDLSELALTRRMCLPGSLHDQFIDGMLYGAAFEITDSMLKINHANGTSYLVFEPAKTNYECEEQGLLVAHFRSNAKGAQVVILDWQGEEIATHRVVSASGAKYKQGDTIFWEKGGEAIFERNRQKLNCRQIQK